MLARVESGDNGVNNSRIGDIPGQVDLAIVAVPAAQAVHIAKECGKAGVHTLLVASAGFAEAGPDGELLQDKLRRRARKWGMRVVGPYSDEDIAGAKSALEGKTEMDAMVAYLQGLGVNRPAESATAGGAAP